MDKTFLAGAAVVAILAITGCGGSSSSGSSGGGTATRTAHFVDNAVTGLHYTCGSSSTKTTGEQGVLRCPDGATARFLIGDIELGEAVVNGNTLFITPADLAGDGADENDNTVINISRFLISLDADQDLANGIQIDPASHLDLGLAIDFSLDPVAFETAIASALDMLTADLPGGPYPLVAEEDAQDHVVMALHLTNAGLYRGTVRHAGNTLTGMTFLVTRQGAAYGSNQSTDGQYAVTGFEEEVPSWLGTTGEGEDFKIDGSTGATHYIDVTMDNGRASGNLDGSDYPRFEATRRLTFDPLYDRELVQDFADLLPLAIGIGENDDAPFVIQDASDGLDGAPFGSRGFEFDLKGAPPSSQVENDVQYGDMIAVEIVETNGQTLRLMALSVGGYLVDATFDLSGAEPTLNATWEHIHEDRNGTTQTVLPLL
ncbi:MAG: hypothetical protein MK001_10975 [Alcanivorax sp.]|jgi:hypothetical protein|nr:hypothetical protein [Alcanivorax sp.]HAR59194.1 hypothetical protein [Alcanivorax sp.]HBX41055.1 hypothetical protein [Marinobacter adhaerens]|tara:strand:+ start:25042 stop:26328 length:1287 start_codon:yes stop_codon:yes gene_type:complete